MRRMLLIAMMMGAFAVVGTSSAMADHGHHGPRGHYAAYRGHGHGHGHHHHGHYRYRPPVVVARPPVVVARPPVVVARPPVVVARPPVIVPQPAVVYPAYPSVGFGLAGRNFSFWFSQ